MPRQERQQLTQRPIVATQQGGRQVRSQVSAGAMDALPSYIPQAHNSDLQGFVSGLAAFQPKLGQMLQEEQARAQEQAEMDRKAGLEQQSTEPSYAQAYFRTDGLVRGQEDASSLVEWYNTEFDKDAGDLERGLAERYQGRLKGITDKDYIHGYNKALEPTLDGIRKAHLDYHRKAVETRVESNAMQLIDGGVRAYVTQNQPIPEGYIEGIQGYTGKHLGVSNERFQELLFETVRKVGDEGHFDAYDVLKRDRPDGSPGLYFDPKWKTEIDKAEARSYEVAERSAQQARDKKQNETLYAVFAEEDPKKAQAMFAELKAGHLFTRADEVIKWERLMAEKVDGKPDAGQLEKEGRLLSKVFQGGVSYRDILDANARGDITSGQRRYLLSEVRRVQQENRAEARAEAQQEAAIYRSREFKDGEEFLKRMLKPRPRDASDFFGNGSEFDQAQLATAHREFGAAVAGKKPSEVGAIVDEIVTRYKKRQNDFTRDQQERVGRGQIPFASLQEAVDAARKGLLSVEEFRAYSDYFKRKAAP